MYYSKTTGGFYTREIHGINMPADAVLITDKQYIDLLSAQTTGQIITGDEKGCPQAAEYKSLLTLQEVKNKKKAEIERLRDSKVASGVPYIFPDGGGIVQTRDEKDIRNIQAQVMAALILSGQPVKLWFRSQEDVSHPMTPEQMITMGLAVYTAINAIYQASWDKKDEVEALATKEAVEAYDITTGWPK